MKILLLHQFFIVGDEPGGSRHQELVRFFKEAGHEVCVIAGSVNYMTNQSKLPFGKFYQRESVFGEPVTWVYAPPTLHMGIFGKLLSFFCFFMLALPLALGVDAELVIASSPPPTVALLGWLVSRMRKIPWIFEVRDLWPASAVDMQVISPGLLTSLSDRCIRFLYRQSNHLITLTWGLENRLVEQGIAREKITTIPNGVDEIFFLPVENKIVELEALHLEKKCVVMYAGALGPANGVIRLLETARALKENPNFLFVIAGDGRERESLKRFAAEQQLSNVLFLGSIPRRDIPALLRYADVCVVMLMNIPEFRRAISNKLFDYMAAGKPTILALPEGDAWRILEEAKGGVSVDPDDLEAMKRWLEYFFERPKERNAMGERAKAYSTARFRRKQLAQTYLSIMQNLVGSR